MLPGILIQSQNTYPPPLFPNVPNQRTSEVWLQFKIGMINNILDTGMNICRRKIEEKLLRYHRKCNPSPLLQYHRKYLRCFLLVWQWVILQLVAFFSPGSGQSCNFYSIGICSNSLVCFWLLLFKCRPFSCRWGLSLQFVKPIMPPSLVIPTIFVWLHVSL